MRFCSINIFSGEQVDGDRKKELTGLFRKDSDSVVDTYLKLLKYYDNANCISLNISCDEDTSEPFIEELAKGYPILHIPFDLDTYVQRLEAEKREFWLNTINDTIKYVCGLWKWEPSFFDALYNKCLIQLGKEE